MPTSNCCGAFTTNTDYGLCPDCHDHCDFIPDECPKCKCEWDDEHESSDETNPQAVCTICKKEMA